MRFQHTLVALQLYFSLILANPAQPTIDELLLSSDLPVVESEEPTLFNLTSFDENGSHLEKRATKLNYILYSITMNGVNKGNWQNWITKGELLLTSGVPSPGTTNGKNKHEITILIGSPAANPIAGSLRYTSNRALYKLFRGTGAASALDYAYVTSSKNTVKLKVDSKLASANQLSNFNARTGLTANVYYVASGGINISTSKNKISGKVALIGKNFFPFSGYAPYLGSISGKPVKKGVIYV